LPILADGIKEHGIVDVHAWSWDEIILKSTIFSDRKRNVFGIRVLGQPGTEDKNLAELPLVDVEAAVATPEHFRKCAATRWTQDGEKKEGAFEIIVKGENFAMGQQGAFNKWCRPPGPTWILLSDVLKVL
jgi:hypothetical protein